MPVVTLQYWLLQVSLYTPGSRMVHRTYSSTQLNLDTNWKWGVSFTPRPVYSGESGSTGNWKGGWFDPTASLNAYENRSPYCSWLNNDLFLPVCYAQNEPLEFNALVHREPSVDWQRLEWDIPLHRPRDEVILGTFVSLVMRQRWDAGNETHDNAGWQASSVLSSG
jgi:hypothetical protein